MSASFPTSLKSFTNPTINDRLDDSASSVDHADQHSDANDEIAALQAKVGIDGSVVTSSHDFKIGAASREGITIQYPSSSEDITIGYTEKAIEISKILAVVRGTSPSVTWTIRHDPDRTAAGNEVVTSGTTTTDQEDGSEVLSFNDATIPAGSYIWLETTAESGTVEELSVTFFF